MSRVAHFFDSSVLLAGLIHFGEQSLPAQRLLDEVADQRLAEVHTAWHCCLEVYSVATRLPVEYRLPATAAARLVEEEILGRFRVHGFPPAAQAEFLSAAAGDGVVGGRIYDLHIAETARAAGAQVVVSDNRRHFTPLLRHGIRVVTAAELVQERQG